jgi:hypothetical protein
MNRLAATIRPQAVPGFQYHRHGRFSLLLQEVLKADSNYVQWAFLCAAFEGLPQAWC